MSAGLNPFEQIDRFFYRHPRLRNIAMQFLDDLIAKSKADGAELKAALDRATTAEAEVATLKQQIADDEAKVKAALDELNADEGGSTFTPSGNEPPKVPGA